MVTANNISQVILELTAGVISILDVGLWPVVVETDSLVTFSGVSSTFLNILNFCWVSTQESCKKYSFYVSAKIITKF